MDRRRFLAGAAASAVGTVGASGVLAGCSSETGKKAGRRGALPAAEDAPFDTVVVLMMENRSFDHLLGWLPGAEGLPRRVRYVDTDGKAHAPAPLAPNWQGWTDDDPKHDWRSVATQWNHGSMDGFLKTAKPGDQFPIGYYVAEDLPVLAKLARSYTTFDHYFCSALAATWPNRFYQLCATTDIQDTGIYPYLDDPAALPPKGVKRPSQIDLAIFDRVRAGGRTAGYYYFTEPMTGLFASGRYDDISHRYDRFKADAAAGKLPNVTFLDPDYGLTAELLGTSNDMHPHGSVKVGDAFLAEVYGILRRSPQWKRMVFVINFDEHGGFFDHVPPPPCRDNNTSPGGHADYKRLGVRVPAIALGPFAPARVETDGPYEHCSILKMIEWRWGLEPMTERDRYAKNLAQALDFSSTRSAPPVTAGRTPPTVARPQNAGAP